MDAVRSVFAVQTQYAQSLPCGVIGRSNGFRADWPDRALRCGELVKTWAMRFTLHAMAADDADLVLAAMGDWAYHRFLQFMERRRGVGRDELERREGNLLLALQSGPKTRAELHQAVPELQGMEGTGWGIDVMGLAYLGKISITSHLGSTTFALRPPSRCGLSSSQATDALVRRYLEAYGLGTPADLRYWSGLPAERLRPSLQRLREEWEPVEVPGFRNLIALRKSVPGFIGGRPPTLRLLAKFDTLLLGHKDKRLYLPDECRPMVFRKAGQVEAVVLARGMAVGTWRMKTTSNRLELTVDLWRETGAKAIRQGVEREAGRLAQKLGYSSFGIRWQAMPLP